MSSISKVQSWCSLNSCQDRVSIEFGNIKLLINFSHASLIEDRDPFSMYFVFAILTRISKNSYLHRDESSFSSRSSSSKLVAMNILSMSCWVRDLSVSRPHLLQAFTKSSQSIVGYDFGLPIRKTYWHFSYG